MNSNTSSGTFAYAAAAFFVTGMALAISQAPPMTFSGPPPAMSVIVALAFTFFHLSLLPVVAAMDAPGWAKGSGYAWIAMDNVIVFMGYFGVAENLVIPMRLGIHLACGTWIIGASLAAVGAERLIGSLAALALVAVSFAGPFIGAEHVGPALGPSGLLLVTWLLMVGTRLNRAV